jgi:hypothetical protein
MISPGIRAGPVSPSEPIYSRESSPRRSATIRPVVQIQLTPDTSAHRSTNCLFSVPVSPLSRANLMILRIKTLVPRIKTVDLQDQTLDLTDQTG